MTTAWIGSLLLLAIPAMFFVSSWAHERRANWNLEMGVAITGLTISIFSGIFSITGIVEFVVVGSIVGIEMISVEIPFSRPTCVGILVGRVGPSSIRKIEMGGGRRPTPRSGAPTHPIGVFIEPNHQK